MDAQAIGPSTLRRGRGGLLDLAAGTRELLSIACDQRCLTGRLVLEDEANAETCRDRIQEPVPH